MSSSTAGERERYVYIAKVAEQAERFDEMVGSMNKLAKLRVELTAEERNLLAVGYRRVITASRSAWRIMYSLEQKEESRKNEENAKRVGSYRHKIGEEFSKICSDALSIIDEHLMSSSRIGESAVFYYKLKGDYHRYLAEIRTGDARDRAVDQALKAYRVGSNTAAIELAPAHPVRLGLALNFSVFFYEILHSPERACRLAKQTFDEATAEIDALNKEAYEDSTLVMQYLRDNLILWT